MRIIRDSIPRREVITFYAEYDLRKKGKNADIDWTSWPWDEPAELDKKLCEKGLKCGVLSAYKSWQLVELEFNEILDCAIVNDIFEGRPQALSCLVTQEVIESWSPTVTREWWEPLSSGPNLPCEWALIIRPALRSESPARWYVEDGSGRILALVQRFLCDGDTDITACAYLGVVYDKRSPFMRREPELCRDAE